MDPTVAHNHSSASAAPEKVMSNIVLPTEVDDPDVPMLTVHAEGGTELTGIVGAYRVLSSFLLSVYTSGSSPLTKEHYLELMNCVESLTTFGEGQKFNVSSMFGKDSKLHGNITEEACVGLLQAMGVNATGTTAFRPVGTIATPFKRERDDSLADVAVTETPTSIPVNPSFAIDDNKVRTLTDTSFNAWDYCMKEKDPDFVNSVSLVMTIFMDPIDLVAHYQLNKGKLRDWTRAIAGKYHENDYHNWAHAVDVTQTMFYMMHRTDTSTFLRNQDTLALYCAGIAHDVGHPGLGTPFLIKTKHELAVTYNDKAPLENMHASLCFTTLADHDFLKGSQKGGKAWSGFNKFRAKVISAILATDMGQHMGFVDRFSTRVHSESPFLRNPTANEEKKDASKTDRRLLLEAFLHTADLGHNTKDFSINKWGVLRLEEEWFKQGDLERDLGIPISPSYDRHSDSVASTQPFFFEAFIRPLLDPWRFIMAEDGFAVIQKSLGGNKKTWEEAVKKHGKHAVPKLLMMMDGEEIHGWIVQVTESKIKDEDAWEYAKIFNDAGYRKVEQLSSFSMENFDIPIGSKIAELTHRRLLKRQVQILAEPEGA